MLHANEATLVLAILSLVIFPIPRPIWLDVFLSPYFAAFSLYAAAVFSRESRQARDVT